MHGGCRILNFGGGIYSSDLMERLSLGSTGRYSHSLNDIVPTGSFEERLQEGGMACKVSKSFTEHESMVYGADWLVCPHPTQNGYFEAAARFVGFRECADTLHMSGNIIIGCVLFSPFKLILCVTAARFMIVKFTFGTVFSKGLKNEQTIYLN